MKRIVLIIFLLFITYISVIANKLFFFHNTGYTVFNKNNLKGAYISGEFDYNLLSAFYLSFKINFTHGGKSLGDDALFDYITTAGSISIIGSYCFSMKKHNLIFGIGPSILFSQELYPINRTVIEPGRKYDAVSLSYFKTGYFIPLSYFYSLKKLNLGFEFSFADYPGRNSMNFFGFLIGFNI